MAGAFSLGVDCNCCGTCSTTICVKICSGTVPVFGAAVTVKSGSTTVGTCTTGSNGCCAVSIPSAGTYTVVVVISGTTYHNASHSLTCGGTLGINITTPTDVVCCGGYAIPYVLTLTDASGSYPFCYYSGGFLPQWYCGFNITRSSCVITTPGGLCVVAAPTSGPVGICYLMQCNAGSSPVFTLQRSWGDVQYPADGSWQYYQASLLYTNCSQSGGTQTLVCGTGTPAACGTPSGSYSQDSQNPTSSAPFAISFTPSLVGGGRTSDPIGGSVSIS